MAAVRHIPDLEPATSSMRPISVDQRHEANTGTRPKVATRSAQELTLGRPGPKGDRLVHIPVVMSNAFSDMANQFGIADTFRPVPATSP
jgi:hypothetical protein